MERQIIVSFITIQINMQEIQLYIFKNKFSYKYDCNFFYDFFNIYIEFLFDFCVCVYVCSFFFQILYISIWTLSKKL